MWGTARRVCAGSAPNAVCRVSQISSWPIRSIEDSVEAGGGLWHNRESDPTPSPPGLRFKSDQSKTAKGMGSAKNQPIKGRDRAEKPVEARRINQDSRYHVRARRASMTARGWIWSI